jgi:hypothetical protein
MLPWSTGWLWDLEGGGRGGDLDGYLSELCFCTNESRSVPPPFSLPLDKLLEAVLVLSLGKDLDKLLLLMWRGPGFKLGFSCSEFVLVMNGVLPPYSSLLLFLGIDDELPLLLILRGGNVLLLDVTCSEFDFWINWPCA